MRGGLVRPDSGGTRVTKVDVVLDLIDNGSLQLPEWRGQSERSSSQ
jgi:hypothetical protein